MQRIEVTGLQYLRTRWYDPSTARFINEDTYEGGTHESTEFELVYVCK